MMLSYPDGGSGHGPRTRIGARVPGRRASFTGLSKLSSGPFAALRQRHLICFK